MRIAVRGKKTTNKHEAASHKSTYDIQNRTRKTQSRIHTNRFCLGLLYFFLISISVMFVYVSKQTLQSLYTNYVSGDTPITQEKVFHITTELRKKYSDVLEVLIYKVGYKGDLFQDSIDTIQQQIQMDYILPSDMSPIFRAIIWLADEPFSKEYANEESSKLLYTNEEGYLETRSLLQRYALAVLYFSTNGDTHWKQCSRMPSSNNQSLELFTGTNSGHNLRNPCNDFLPGKMSRFLSHNDHECLWYGITCAPQEPKTIIVMIDLTNAGLYGSSLPKELILLSGSLELLWLAENPNLSGNIPHWIQYFKRMISLSLYDTHIGGSIPEELYNLQGIESIRLHNCQLEGTLSSNIGKMTHLKWLWIHGNQLEGKVPNQIQLLHDLEGLSLYGNQFQWIHDESDLNGICALRKIKLEHFWVDCYQGDKCSCCSKCLRPTQ